MSARLLDQLNQECAATGKFIELLDVEAQTMAAGDFGALPALAQLKSELADEITRLTAERVKEQL